MTAIVSTATSSTTTTVGGVLINAAIFLRGGAAARLGSAPVKTPSLIQELYNQWYQLSEISRFFVSGNIGNVCFYFIENFINNQLCNASSLPPFVKEYKDTVSFFVGYILQIVSQHSLNAFLVYGLETINTREKYIKTLLGQYSAYGLSLCGSTLLNLLLLRCGMEKTIAFFTTMAVFACANYFVIGWIVRLAAEKSSADKVKNGDRKKKGAGIQRATRMFARGGAVRDYWGSSRQTKSPQRNHCDTDTYIHIKEVNESETVIPDNFFNCSR